VTNQPLRLETVEEFKLRIAAIVRAKPEQISTPPTRQPPEADDKTRNKT